MTVVSLKSDLRTSLRGLLAKTPMGELGNLSEKIQNRLSNFARKEAGRWGAYQPLPDEPQIHWSNVASNIDWAYPKVEGETLAFKTGVSKFVKANWRIMEPLDGILHPVQDLDVVIVPGLGFDRRGYRLGRGKGYYDRALKDFKGCKIGVCFNMGLREEIPAETHDVKFDIIMTDLETLVLRK